MGNRIGPEASPSPELVKLATTSVEKCESVMQGVFGCDLRVDALERNSAFGIDLQSAAFGDLRLTRWTCLNFAMTWPGCGVAQITLYNEGGVGFCSDRHTLIQEEAHTGRLSRPGEVFKTRKVKASGISLRFPALTLIERAERLTFKPHGAAMFDDAFDRVDLKTPLGAELARTAQNAIIELANLGLVGLGPLATTGYEELLLNLATCAIFPKVAREAGFAPLDCGPKIISRVRDYIRANSSMTLELSLIANNFGVSLRTMQENFRRYYGCSPREFLLDCRLDDAHRLLRAADGAQTVAAIALRCGFSDPKHFAAKYRDRYMESPSTTLRAAMR